MTSTASLTFRFAELYLEGSDAKTQAFTPLGLWAGTAGAAERLEDSGDRRVAAAALGTSVEGAAARLTSLLSEGHPNIELGVVGSQAGVNIDAGFDAVGSGEVTLASTAAAGLVAVHRRAVGGGLEVTSVIANPVMEMSSVQRAALAVASNGAVGGDVRVLSVFSVPLGAGHSWSVTLDRESDTDVSVAYREGAVEPVVCDAASWEPPGTGGVLAVSTSVRADLAAVDSVTGRAAGAGGRAPRVVHVDFSGEHAVLVQAGGKGSSPDWRGVCAYLGVAKGS